MEAEAIAQTELSEVPSAEHWRSFASIPGDFDANAVWSYTQKKIERGKPCSECVFCGKTFNGHNATKMQQHHSGMHFVDIQLCIGCSNGTMPVWFSDAVKSAVVKKMNEKRASEQVINPGKKL